MTEITPSRRVTRKLACQCVYASIFSYAGAKKIAEEIEIDVARIDKTYLEEVFVCLQENREDLKKMIEKSAPKFEFENIPHVHVALLEIAIVEMLHIDSIPPAVAINEAVENAKTFTDEAGKNFINGVLQSVKTAHE